MWPSGGRNCDQSGSGASTGTGMIGSGFPSVSTGAACCAAWSSSSVNGSNMPSLGPVMTPLRACGPATVPLRTGSNRSGTPPATLDHRHERRGVRSQPTCPSSCSPGTNLAADPPGADYEPSTHVPRAVRSEAIARPAQAGRPSPRLVDSRQSRPQQLRRPPVRARVLGLLSTDSETRRARSGCHLRAGVFDLRAMSS